MEQNDKTMMQLIQETHDTVVELRTIVVGVSNSGGLVKDVAVVRNELTEVKELMSLRPRVERLENEVHDDNNGLLSRMGITETKQKDNRSILTWGGGVIVTLLITILGLIIAHLEKG